jgi:hypothetical protein
MNIINRYLILVVLTSISLQCSGGGFESKESLEFTHRRLLQGIEFRDVEDLDFRPTTALPQMKNCEFLDDIRRSNFEGRQLVNVEFVGKKIVELK